MINLRFSRLPKHRKFNYTPVFYDEDKEELHARVDDIKREMGELEHTRDSVEENIRRAYKAKQVNNRYGTAPGKKFYSIRVFGIAIMLGILFYYLWDSNVLETIFEDLYR
ncbi:hypothetical protein N9811_02165 [Bacteroidia bacterium]|jgi:hypothetical protein|nr:hypothetical protein [Bacteroidota bacterium]MDB4173591.1 hypothetical protein [Bacteroidia bacterium]